MRVETVLLADAASTSQDGKLNLLGGGITRINLPTLPWNLVAAVVIRAKVDPSDLEGDAPHRLALDLRNPAGSSKLPRVLETPVLRQALRETAGRSLPHEDQYLHIIAAFQNIPLTEEGVHSVVVLLGDALAWELHIPVVRVGGAVLLSPPPSGPAPAGSDEPAAS
jgi:hypothetical protein